MLGRKAATKVFKRKNKLDSVTLLNLIFSYKMILLAITRGLNKNIEKNVA